RRTSAAFPEGTQESDHELALVRNAARHRDAVEKSVVIGRGGSRALDFNTLRGYIKFAQDLPPGHIFQSHILVLSGYAELTTDPSNINAAVHDFVQPDVTSPEKARDVTLGIKRRSKVLRPASVTVSVLN